MDSPACNDPRLQFEIDRVSEFSRPGVSGSWDLDIVSVVMDCMFVAKDEAEGEKSHILGVDLNLAAAPAYPKTAAVGILSQMSLYFDVEAVQDVDNGPLDTQVVLLKEGMLSGALPVASMSFTNLSPRKI